MSRNILVVTFEDLDGEKSTTQLGIDEDYTDVDDADIAAFLVALDACTESKIVGATITLSDDEPVPPDWNSEAIVSPYRADDKLVIHCVSDLGRDVFTEVPAPIAAAIEAFDEGADLENSGIADALDDFAAAIVDVEGSPCTFVSAKRGFRHRKNATSAQ